MIYINERKLLSCLKFTFFIGKLHSLHSKQKAGPESTLEDITSAWSTGIPASIMFLGKSFHAVPKGPGGIILHDSPKSNSPIAKSKPPIADFSHTANMLTLLSKAETKMKTQAALKTGISFLSYLINEITRENLIFQKTS